MWVYDLKNRPGRDTLEKARVVVLGNHQGSLDFGDTYLAVAQATSIRIVLAYAASRKWFIFTFHIKTAFLNADLKEEVYCQQIPHLPEPNKHTIL